MLGTLIKHEWKYVWMKFVLFLLVTAMATVLGVFSFRGFYTIGDESDVGKIVVAIIGFLVYYGAVMTVSFGFLLLCGIRFYKNVYGDESYITHTLPVTAREIHLSKLIVYSICVFVLSLLLFISIFMVTGSVFSFASAEGGEAFTLSTMFSEMGINTVSSVGIVLLALVVSSICNVAMIYASIVLGQYWKKHKIVGTIVWYVIITFIMSIVGVISTLPMLLGNSTIETQTNAYSVSISPVPAEAAVFNQVLLLAVFESVVVGVICYFVADHGLTKKLNLE